MENDINLKEPHLGRKDSFFGARSVVLSKKQLDLIKSDPCLKTLYISDIGFYPHAKDHYRKRKRGCKEHILIYCIDGSGVIQVEENTYNLNANSFFVIPANKGHKYWSRNNPPWSIYWLHFKGEHSFGFEQFYNRIIRIDHSTDSRINDRLKLFNEIITSLETGFSIENINYANMCLHSLLASFFFIETYRLVKGYKNSNPVDASISFMHENIHRFITIKELSEHVQLSESHFSKVFRNKTGSSPLHYFINLKMQEAIRYLSNQSLKIKEVAYKLGYNDPYYFTRIFTKCMGASPASFVKRY